MTTADLNALGNMIAVQLHHNVQVVEVAQKDHKHRTLQEQRMLYTGTMHRVPQVGEHVIHNGGFHKVLRVATKWDHVEVIRVYVKQDMEDFDDG